MDQPADVSVDYQPDGRGSSLVIRTPAGETDVRLNLLGRHNALNALAATAAAQVAGATLKQIRTGLASVQAVPGRLQPRAGISEAQVIDDTYNANPGSVLAALQVLKDLSGERVLVLGEMAELGPTAVAIHRRVGELAAQYGIHRLYVMGELTRHTAEAYGKKARHFATHEALIDVLLDQLHPAMTVLVKGSRVMQMERVVKGITRATNDVVTKGG
jgi:UDP-N-acetylmuramoyl-tripeptide--D-alanyl-D-alanine ligase